MPLSPNILANALEQSWLASNAGSLPASVAESADRFASAVASWFALATAAGIPVTTAQLRRSQLVGAAAQSLAIGNAAAAGSSLGAAVVAYIAGQSFGPGCAGPPSAAALAASESAAVFADLDMPVRARAGKLAAAFQAAAISTVVVFPSPMPPAPVM